jgi:hypothetical protein
MSTERVWMWTTVKVKKSLHHRLRHVASGFGLSVSEYVERSLLNVLDQDGRLLRVPRDEAASPETPLTSSP